ncbi:hypothetical protein D3C84_342120 [compost metagenome]
MADGRQAAQHGFQRHQQLLEGRGLVQADIDRPLLHVRFLQGLHHHRDQIGDIDEVTCLLAIPEQGNRQAFLRTLAKNTDHTGVR